MPSFQKPVTGDFSDGKSALDLARKLARKLNARALVNHNIAVSKRDPNVSTGEKKKINDIQKSVILMFIIYKDAREPIARIQFI